MKMNIKRICKCIAFGLVTVFLLGIISDVMTCNDLTSQLTIEGIELEERNTLDAVVIGASEVFSGYSPTEAWKEYGYTSYSLGLAGAPCKVYKPLLAELLIRQKPKVVAFEVNGFIHSDEYAKLGKLRNVYDNLSWSPNRIRAIHENVPKGERINFYFPLNSYHSLWNSPTRLKRHLKNRWRVRKTGTTYLKGVSTYSYAYDMQGLKVDGKLKYTEQSQRYLKDLLDYCKEQGIEQVLFFKAPGGATVENPEKLQEIFATVESYGYDTLDCSRENMEKIGIDIHKDFYNRDHMNIYGMKKFTSYLGDYFVNEMGLKPEHDAELSAKWDTYAAKSDEIFEDCDKNIKDHKVIHYKESAFYVKPEPFADPAKALNISPKNFK